MRPVNGGGLGARSGVSALPTIMSVMGTGQSLGAGAYGTPLVLTAPQANTLKWYDPSGAYTDPTAGSLVPLLSPIRAGAVGNTSGVFPLNILGESPDVACAFATQLLAADEGYSFYSHADNVCQGGASISVIEKGGSGNSYASSLVCIQALVDKLSSVASGATAAVDTFLFTHGEADAQGYPNNLAYQPLAAALGTNMATDFGAITAQAIPGVVIATQQTSEPQNHGGTWFQSNTTAAALLAQYLATPNAFILAGPKYHLGYGAPGGYVHLNPGTQYVLLGELYARVRWQLIKHLYLGGPPPTGPLRPTSIVRTGTSVAITCAVPVAPLQIDGVNPSPHQSGSALQMWLPGKGFEAYDRTLGNHTLDADGGSLYGGAPSGICITAVSNTSPVVLTTEPHNYTTGDLFYPFNFLDSSATPMSFNGQLITVTCADNTHVTLNGTTAAGTWSGIGFGMSPIPITNLSLSSTVATLTIGRVPIGDLSVGCAEFADVAPGTPTGGFQANGVTGGGRCSLIMDSCPDIGPITSTTQPNRMVAFTQHNIP